MLDQQIAALPPIIQYTQEDGQEIVCIPLILAIPVDPLEGFTKEEAIKVARERLSDLPLKVTLGGVEISGLLNIP